MKPLATAKRAAILQSLCEGMSVRATSRITGAATNTVLDLLERVGEACSAYQDDNLRGLERCDDIQLDEIFSFVGCREKSKKRAKGNHPGEVWCWIALCAKTKLRITRHVGERNHRAGMAFCHDLSQRVSAISQVTRATGCNRTVSRWRRRCRARSSRSW